MEKRSPASAVVALLVVTPAWSHPCSPAGSCPSQQPHREMPVRGLCWPPRCWWVSQRLHVPKQLKNGIFVFALSSGDTLPRLGGSISSLFQLVSRQAGSGGASASPRMAAGQNIAFPAPWGEEMAAGSRLRRWGCLFDILRPFCYWGGRSWEVNLTPKLGPLAVARDGENVMASSREEPARELAGKDSRGKITSSSSAGVGGAVALERPERCGRQHPSPGDLQRDVAT